MHSQTRDVNKLEFQIFVDHLDRNTPKFMESVMHVRSLIMSLVPQDHLWHLHPLTINHSPSSSMEGGGAYLVGCLSFGEALDDEWLAVAVLTEASLLDQRLSICMRDDDGTIPP
jgi:hypothetical protein